jgi:hypothetical protein
MRKMTHAVCRFFSAAQELGGFPHRLWLRKAEKSNTGIQRKR